MRVIKDFECPDCDNDFEAMIDNEGKVITCPSCQSPSAKVVYKSFNFALDGTDPGFPTAYDKWATRHEKAGKLR